MFWELLFRDAMPSGGPVDFPRFGRKLGISQGPSETFDYVPPHTLHRPPSRDACTNAS